ncbi:MAG TPA: class I SAM-dependent methyltransferase [Prosthecochloris aestuarii]|uniref:Class I SAM-dependent methyltransferase n=1 Tax=Prosthecochloris aestuarii TaxID=1102 RepID=A0A831SQY0_PROAE|nr:class I SAM-dependent methyltransferase [Prosthecochloris sp.]HED30317.1 class I SAM-dependent methyltransferase [Prosthecochloris aestuarii]
MTDASSSHSPEWFAEWFNHPLYLELYSHRDSSEAFTCVETILDAIQAEETGEMGFAVLDIACGAGRHAMEFARRGYHVTANDLSPYLLECTARRAGEEQLELACSRQDMRTLALDRKFDLVVQLFSSFGYFTDPDDDQKVLENASHLLKKEGWYVLDLIHPAYLRAHLQPHTEKRIGSLHVDEHRHIEKDLVIKDITISSDNETLKFRESVRLFEPGTIRKMLAKAGFEIKRMLGDYHGTPFDPEQSPRMLLICRKGQE